MSRFDVNIEKLNVPLEELQNRVKEAVQVCISQFNDGGENYFNALDEITKNDMILVSAYIKYFTEKEGVYNLIVSGEIAHKVISYKALGLIDSKVKIIAVTGGLRRGVKIDYPLEDLVRGKYFIFFDDSYYSGKTEREVTRAVNESCGLITRTYVLYDGSPVKQENVESLYRYYDNIESEEK